MRKRLLITLLVPVAAFAQPNDSAVIRNMATYILQKGNAYENLRYLCKQIGPRLSGSANAQKAVEATSRMLKEAGADTVYLQPCMVPHWVRGEKEEATVLYGKNKKALHVCALGMSVGTAPAGIKAGLVEVKNFDELAALGAEKVKGKIVFFNYPMRPELVNGGYGDAVRYRSRGPVEAARLGAVAILIRSVTHALDNNPHTGATRYDSSITKIPAMACSTLDAEWLSAILNRGEKPELFMKMNCRQLPDTLSYNVVGELKGTDFPNEVITAGGHLDSWDLAEGAHDDGTGCVQSMAVLEAFKGTGLRPKRTIRVVMFMNEENGARGGSKYAELAAAEGKRQLFAIESDGGGFGCIALGISGTEAQQATLRGWLPLFIPYNILAMPDGGGGTDIEPLKRLGTVMCGVDDFSQRYFDHHHAPNDVFEAVNKRELEMGAIGMAAICWLVSEHGL